jgi:cytochrome oxidase Cu insertion factor (SCO1/SenC/PrrC family)
MRRNFVLTFMIVVCVIASRAQTRTKPLAVGEIAPDFTLVDHRGQKITLSDSKGRNPVVVMFYRGYW